MNCKPGTLNHEKKNKDQQPKYKVQIAKFWDDKREEWAYDQLATRF